MRMINGHRIVNTIAIPTEKEVVHRAAAHKYPFHLMEVGESVYIKAHSSVPKMRACVFSNLTYWKKRTGEDKKFVMRTTGKGLRVWRIK